MRICQCRFPVPSSEGVMCINVQHLFECEGMSHAESFFSLQIGMTYQRIGLNKLTKFISPSRSSLRR